MAILIDGYNLLHGTDLFGRGRNAGTLQASREALVQFVMSTVPPNELSQTTIVFDAKDAPPGLPRLFIRDGGLTVRYAAEYADADELLIELIQSDNAPRKLLVVSSDHQVQRAAKRRRAQIAESRAWYLSMRSGTTSSERSSDSPSLLGAFSAEEMAELERDVATMLADDADPAKSPVEIESPPAERRSVEAPAALEKKPPGKRRIRARRRRKAQADEAQEMDLSNPFPPGYAEDLLADENDR